MAEFWIMEEEYYLPLTIFSCIVALFLNFVSVPLSIYFSKYSLGSCKIVMMLFFLNNMFHSFVDTFTLPKYFFMWYLVVSYTSGPIRHLGQGPSYFRSTWLCVVFLPQIFVEALHFLFRYIVLCRNVTLVIISSCLLYGLLTAPNFSLNLYPDEEFYEYVGNDSLMKKNLTAQELQGDVLLYKKHSPDGELVTNWNGCHRGEYASYWNYDLLWMENSSHQQEWKAENMAKHLSQTLAITCMSSHALEMNKILFNMRLVRV